MNGKRTGHAKKRDYQHLLNKIYLQIIGLLLGAAALVVGIRIVFRGHFADAIVWLVSKIGNISWDDAHYFYWTRIQNNLPAILCIVSVLFFLILLRLAMRAFTRYFDQIISGVDQLAQESDRPIEMSPELDFMAKTLTQVQTKLRQRTEQAQAAEQRKNDLVVYLAHDIKTPLTSVIGYLSLLDQDTALTEEKRAHFTHIALEKAYRLEGLINEFFEITRYRFQSVPLRREEINLCYMMVQLSDELYPKLRERNKTMELDIPEELELYVDADKMARVFNNLLKNAIAYSESGSTIQVRAREAEKRITIAFTSRGEIPQEKLNDIFEKFYRLDASRSSATGGAGLGLAIARDIVRLHSGEVTAQSDGTFTTFTVTLPQKKKGGSPNGPV